jgi:hypothetical protein
MLREPFTVIVKQAACIYGYQDSLMTRVPALGLVFFGLAPGRGLSALSVAR